MVYNLPELVLVGAAQNLVLETSERELKDADIDCFRPYPQDQDLIVSGTYNFESTW